MIRLVELIPSPLLRMVYRMPIVLRLASSLLRSTASADTDFTVTVKNGPLQGRQLVINSTVPNYYWIRGHDEPEVIEAITANVKKGQRVVDIGAYIGVETLLFSQLVGSEGQVVSIEPDPANYSLLEANIRLHDRANVQLMRIALADRQGFLPFMQDRGVTSRLAGLSSDCTKAPEETSVAVHTLDGLFAGKDMHVHFVKIDVEDFEAQVLDGAQRVLQEQHPHILVELHSYQSAKGCSEILLDAGYRLELIQPATGDVETFLAGQPRSSYLQGFQRCHMLARYPQ